MAKIGSGSVSQSVGDYAKAIWLIAGENVASTNAIAEELELSPASVSGMLARLSDMELIEYERYHGARLTPQGRHEALRLLRRHRLLETFMIERLNYSWDEVHEEAEAIEHTISDRFAERLAELLDHPTHDPHGDPIPTRDGVLPNTPSTPLAQLQVGETLVVARLTTQISDVLAHLAKLDIVPGRRLTVTAREPLGGLMQIDVQGAQQVVSKELATLIRGEVTA